MRLAKTTSLLAVATILATVSPESGAQARVTRVGAGVAAARVGGAALRGIGFGRRGRLGRARYGYGGYGGGLYVNGSDYSETNLHLDGFAGDGEHGAYVHPIGRLDWKDDSRSFLRGGGFSCSPYHGDRPGIHTICYRH